MYRCHAPNPPGRKKTDLWPCFKRVLHASRRGVRAEEDGQRLYLPCALLRTLQNFLMPLYSVVVSWVWPFQGRRFSASHCRAGNPFNARAFSKSDWNQIINQPKRTCKRGLYSKREVCDGILNSLFDYIIIYHNICKWIISMPWISDIRSNSTT